MVSGALSTAAAPATGPQTYQLRVWQTDDGLPQNSVHAIAQTSDGYLWVGTHEGLVRFDGMRFTPAAEPTLQRGWITALCPTRDGTLWIACDGFGVAALRDGRVSWLAETNGLPSNQTRCLLETRDGSLWIGGESGLSRLREGKLTNFTDRQGLGDNAVRAVAEDAAGNLRIATRRGLTTLTQEGAFSTMTLAAGMVGNNLKCVTVDGQGRVWAGSNEGLHCLDGESRTFLSASDGLPDRITTVLYADQLGQVWVGTYGGLARVEEKHIVSRPTLAGLPGDRIQAIFQDAEANLWIGSWDGLYRLTPARFTTYSLEQGLNCNNVMSVCEDRSGAMLFGTWGGGLNELRDGKIVSYGVTNGLTHDLALSLHEGKSGQLWVGMEFGGGLNRLTTDRQNQFTTQAGLTNAAIRAIHEADDGTLWLGTSAGIKHLKADQLTTYTTNQGLAGNVIMAIHRDRRNRLWFGTDGGLSRWEQGHFVNLTTRDGLSHNGVNAIYEDAGGALWIGTKGGGLNRFADGKFTAYTTREGSFSDEIYEILEDNNGTFWMSCRKGIFRANRAELEALARGETDHVHCAAYGRADGLASVQCNGVAKPAGWKARDGRLWFATIRGAVAVDAQVQPNLRPPPVAIEEIVSDRGTFHPRQPREDTGAELTVPPGRGSLEIHYTALSLTAPEKNQFRYRLEPLDPTWVDGGTARTVRYNNLAPGRYRFHVTASNNEGVWTDTGATLHLHYQPHYWQTHWFKLTLALAGALLAVALTRARLHRLRALEQLRVQIAADLHDDVGSRLTKVAMITEHLDAGTATGEPHKPLVRTLAATTREIIQAMDEIVWTINPQNDTLDDLANYIFQYAQDYFAASGVRCRLDLPARLPELKLTTQERHNLFMAVKEALNNVVKHAQASEVRIRLSSTGGKLVLTVSDNGRGFDENGGAASGNGLGNMRQRLERIGGRFTLSTRPGGGTEISLEAEGR